MSFIEAIIGGAKPAPDYTVSQWADNYRILPSEGSVEPGKYRTSRTPYCREIMDALSVYSGIDDVTVMKATQLGMTEIGNNFFGYIVDTEPGPILMVFPTDKLAEDHSSAKLGPTIDETPELAQKISPRKTKTAGNATLRKKFPGGILFISGANSPANYRNKSIRYLMLDDLDGFPATVKNEGDPADLAEKRTDSYSARKKIYRNSTPTIKGISKIEKHFLASDQRRYYVPCPFCGNFQPLVWGGPGKKRGIKFTRDKVGEVIAVWYECRACHEAIDESFKPQMLEAGKWKAKYPHRKKRGYHLSSLYSPLGWVSWEQIVKEFLAAKSSPERLQVWTNTRLAEVWDEAGSQPDWILLKNRAEAYRLLTWPDPVCFLTAGVDVQANRLPVVVRGWGKDERSWLVLYTELFGDPNQPEVWQDLDRLLQQAYIGENGDALYINTMAVDAGYLSNAVYNFCRFRPLNTIAVKGINTGGRTSIITKPSVVDVTWQGELIKGGCQLWPVSVDPAKSQIYSRLAMVKDGPGFYHWPIGLDDEYYLQLTAEKKITKYRNGFEVYEWAKLRDRNDALDIEVYAFAAAIRAGLHLITDWQAVKASQTGKGSAAASDKRQTRTNQKPKRW
jgi:phage terminase large subunit GpA-like protein